MKKSRCTEQQIAFALQQAETGTSVEEVCRKLGVSQATFFRWKKVYGGLMPSEVPRLKSLEAENTRLCQLVADLTLDKERVSEVIKNGEMGRGSGILDIPPATACRPMKSPAAEEGNDPWLREAEGVPPGVSTETNSGGAHLLARTLALPSPEGSLVAYPTPQSPSSLTFTPGLPPGVPERPERPQNRSAWLPSGCQPSFAVRCNLITH